MTLPTVNLKHLERTAIRIALEMAKGNKSQAARELGVCKRTLRNKLKAYGMTEWMGRGPFPKAAEPA